MERRIGRRYASPSTSLRLVCQIAEILGDTRTEVQCLHRWNKVLMPGLHKGPWTDEEDEILRQHVQTTGIDKVKWAVVASQVNQKPSRS